ncbi:MAG: hypothetical protein VX341_07065 [Bdellovibrionota bacterium]|nr:hypothetical protein [Bdellovibrionota bacterium]
MKLLTLTFILLIQVSCQQVSEIAQEASSNNNQNTSTVEESELISASKGSSKDMYCPMVYEPVCAKVSRDENCKDERICEFIDKTYSSDCFANIDNAEILYPGECMKEDTDENQEPIKEEQIIKNPEVKFCFALYDPVCGKSPGKLGTEKTYSNMCYLEMAGAEFLRYGECDKETLKM